MTDTRKNFWGRYSEEDVRIIHEENRILEMRWEVFEGLYDTTRQELEKVQYALAENVKLRQQIVGLEEETNLQDGILNLRDQMINRLEEEIIAFRKLAEEAVLENEKLHKQIALYIYPSNDVVNTLKELENETVKKSDLSGTPS